MRIAPRSGCRWSRPADEKYGAGGAGDHRDDGARHAWRPHVLGQHLIRTAAANPSSTVGTLLVGNARASAPIFPIKSGGSGPTFRPRKSATWVEAMVTAIPQVNPVVTGWGTYLISEPSRKRTPGGQNRGITLASRECADQEIGQPVPGDDGVDQADEGPRRSADLNAGSTQGGHEEPSDDRGVNAGGGRGTRGNSEPDGKRQGDNAHRESGKEIRLEAPPGISAEDRELRSAENEMTNRLSWRILRGINGVMFPPNRRVSQKRICSHRRFKPCFLALKGNG